MANPPSEVQTSRRIEQLIADSLPPGWALGKRARPGQRSEADWEVRSPDGQNVIFSVERKSSLTGRQTDPAVTEMGNDVRRPLVTERFLSPTIRATLTERGVSYADATGNLRLVADRPGLLVERPGATKDPWPSDDALRTLRGRGAGRAVRALVDHRTPYGVRLLAGKAAVPLGTLSRTLDLLDREGLVTRGDRGEVVELDWERALRRWSEDYEFARSNRVSYYLDPRGTSAVVTKLSDATWTYALTGATAALTFAPISPARQVAIYTDDVDQTAERLRLRPADAGANVVLAEPFDPVVFDRTTMRDGLRIAAASQLVADLLTGTGREPAEGEELLLWMRNNEEAWRA